MLSSRTSALAVLALASGTVFAFQQVADSAEKAKPIGVGVQAPDASLKTLEGKDTTLKAITAGKPTVIIFYRGAWCPFCNRHLSELGKIQGDLINRGYQLIAISPDTPAELEKMRTKDGLTYQMYSDSTAEAMKKFGVAFRVDDPTFTTYRDKYSVDLEKYSGEKHHILPVPSVFITDKNGKIVFAHANADYKVRMKAEDVLAAAKGN